MYLDSTAHAAFTGGGPAAISAAPGTEWSAFDGRIRGRMLALMPARQIVQSWRSFEWQVDELDAVLVLAFTATSEGATSTSSRSAFRTDVRHPPERMAGALFGNRGGRTWKGAGS